MAAEAVTLRKVSWLPNVAAALSRATYPEGRAIGGEVVAGVSECWELSGIGYAVTRLELHDTGPELVMVATEGRGFYCPEFLSLDGGLVARIARANGAETVRIHSRRPAVGRYLRRWGWREELRIGESIFYGRVKK